MEISILIATASLLGLAGVPQSVAQMTVVNAASFDAAQPIGAGSFATIFGQNLCAQTMAGDWIGPGQLPTTLGDCSVTVGGASAMLQYVSPGQVNFIMPLNVGSGQMSMAVNSGAQVVNGTVMTGSAGPGTFALNGMGMGEGAMLNATLGIVGPFSTMTTGQPTYVSMYVTGLNLSRKPIVTIGGITVDVMWFGNAPGFAGLEQINFMMPAGMAGVGRVPVTVTSDGQVSNVTFMHVLPTSSMMEGMPGWGNGMSMAENRARGHETSYLALNAANNTALITDEDDDVVRVISLTSNSTTATITLPSGSQSHAIAVNSSGTLAAAGLSAAGSVALIDLSQNKLVSVIGTGYYPSRLVFSGSNLLVTNEGSGTVSVIDTASRTVVQTVTLGLGVSGIAVSANTAVVANMLAGSVSIIDLTNYTVSTVALPAGTRPADVGISTTANKAVISTPMTNGFLLLDLGTKSVSEVGTITWNGMGPGAVAVSGNTVFLANQMTASVTVADLASGTVVKTFPVDPGPVALAVNSTKNQLLVLAEGTGTLDVVDLTNYGILQRINAGDTERHGEYAMPVISSLTPSSGAAGASFTLTLAGSGLQSVQGIEFLVAGSNGMMGGGHGSGLGQTDPNIKISNLQANAGGSQITASIQILSTAATGARQVRLQTSYGTVMGMVTSSTLSVTK